MFVFFRTNNRYEFVLKETRCGMIKAEEIEMLIDASDRLVSAVSMDFRRYLFSCVPLGILFLRQKKVIL